MSDIIQPRVLKGFRDFLPDAEIPRQELIGLLQKHFTSFGYTPIDTPALEYTEILLSKGGGETDKQTYRFTDHGGRDVALRFDLTVPFARYVANHRSDLVMPFKRYHIGKVWRGENTQRGRYREFIQCDFDIVGTDSPSADLEIMLMMADGIHAAGAGTAHIRFSHRGLFNKLLVRLGLKNECTEILRIVDKMAKIGRNEVRILLTDLMNSRDIDILLDFITPIGSNRETLEKMAALSSTENDQDHSRMLTILNAVDELQMQHILTLDPSITRGLDYYTGIVFETFLNELPGLGSVCSGGRYNNLTGLFMKEPLGGVGASIGLDRLMAGMDELGKLKKRTSATDVLILMLDESLLARYQSYARDFRAAGLSAEVYPEAKKITAQFKYAEAKGIPLAIIAGPDEAEGNTMNLKDLHNRVSFNGLSLMDAAGKAIELLRQTP